MSGQKGVKKKKAVLTLGALLLFFSSALWSAPGDCFNLFQQLKNQKLTGQSLKLKAAGSETELAFAFEKEGSWYPELPRRWFELDSSHIKRVLQIRLDAETKGKKERVLTKLLKHFLDTDDPKWILAPAEVRRKISPLLSLRTTLQRILKLGKLMEICFFSLPPNTFLSWGWTSKSFCHCSSMPIKCNKHHFLNPSHWWKQALKIFNQGL